MSDRQFEVSDPRPGDVTPITMGEDELRQTYGFLVDVLDLEGFRQVIVVANGTRIEVNEVFDTPNQHPIADFLHPTVSSVMGVAVGFG